MPNHACTFEQLSVRLKFQVQQCMQIYNVIFIIICFQGKEKQITVISGSICAFQNFHSRISNKAKTLVTLVDSCILIPRIAR